MNIREEYLNEILDFMEQHYTKATTDGERALMCAIMLNLGEYIGVNDHQEIKEKLIKTILDSQTKT